MDKVDFKRELRELYQPSRREFSVVEVPRLQFLMIDGQGDPNTAVEYKEALETLFPVAYKLKSLSKRELERDFVVMPLEGLWWSEDMDSFISRSKDCWEWTMMILQPEWITQSMFRRALEMLEGQELPAFDRLRMEEYSEGRCVQIMHIGSYDDEGPVLKRLHEEYLPQNGFGIAGKHHEIYLSDPRRTAPEKLRTVLRQPVHRLPTAGTN